MGRRNWSTQRTRERYHFLVQRYIGAWCRWFAREHALRRKNRASLKILVVDDNTTNCEILEHQLASWQLRSESVHSGQRALETLRTAARNNTPYELAIIDWHMPEMDGLQLAREIRSDELLRNTLLIMLSSAAADDGGECLLDAGINAHINKPARPARLRKCLAQVLTSQQDKSDQQLPRPEGPTSTARGIFGGHILLVEDNPVNREVATHMLLAMQCRVDEVANGQEAVEIVRRVNFDLVLMDCEMPVLDGYAATKTIRNWEADTEQKKHLPIVALTAHALPEDRRRCLATGMDDYLSKPFSVADLTSVLARWLPLSEPTPTTLPDSQLNDALSDTCAVSPGALETIRSLDPDEKQCASLSRHRHLRKKLQRLG